MILKKLLIENLRSYEKQEIEFPKGSILLSGDIGAGKTTILLAIEFALFGLQPGQKGSSILRNSTDEGRVILEFEVKGKTIIIERTLKRSKKSITQDYASISIDDEKFEGSVTEIKNKILRLLNYPLEFAKKTNILYKFTVYTPQEEMKQIILEPGEIRLNTLRYVFGIDKYKRIEENTYLLTAKLRERIRINEGIIFYLDENKKDLREKKDKLIELKEKQILFAKEYDHAVGFRESKESSLKEIEDKINEKNMLESEKGKVEVLMHEKKKQIEAIDNSMKSLNLQIQETKKISFNEEEYKSLKDRIKFQENKEEELQKGYMQTIGKISSVETRKKELDNLNDKIISLEKCPTCLQEVSETYKKNILSVAKSEIDETQRIISEMIVKRNKLIDEINLIKKIKEEFKKKQSDLELLKIKLENVKEKENRIKELEEQKVTLQISIKSLMKHYNSISESIKDYTVYVEIHKNILLEIKEAKTKENQEAIKSAEINKEIQFSEEQIRLNHDEIRKKEDLKKKTDGIREIEYWVSEKFIPLILFIEKQVMLTLKGEFSRLFSKWFSILVSDSLTAKLSDDFSPIIEHQDYELDYSFLSGGERTAIALAYRLSLNQVINSLLSNINTNNLVILDEPTDGFSEQQLEKMRDVLNELNAEQLILVSHEQKIEDFVDNIIRLEKDSGVSHVRNQ